MRGRRAVVAMVIGLSLAPVESWGAAWTLGNNVRVVQSGGGGTNVYTSLSAALANIPANNTTPILIKIMPGTYTQAVPLVLKPFVSIEGSGRTTTFITSAIPIDARVWGGAATKATVIVPSTVSTPVSIRAVAVTNTSSAGGIALLANGAVTVEDVSLKAGSPGPYSAASPDYGGLIASGSTASARAFNVVVETACNPSNDPVHPCDGDVSGIGAFHEAQLSVSDSRVISSGGAWSNGIVIHGRTDGGAKGTIADSVVEVSNLSAGSAIELGEKGVVSDTKAAIVTAIGAGDSGVVVDCWGTQARVRHSELLAPASPPIHSVVSYCSVASSLLDGPDNGTSNIIFCWNPSFAPISSP